MLGGSGVLDDEDIRLVLEAVAGPVIACDAGDRIVFVNPAAGRLLGWSSVDLCGQPLATIVPERLRSIGGQPFDRYVVERCGSTHGHGVRAPALHRDGVEINVEFSANKLVVSRGELVVFCLRPLVEIGPEEHPPGDTGAASSNVAAVTRQETLQLIFENAPLGIFHFDVGGVITACNDYFANIIGSSRRVLVGLDMTTLPDLAVVESVCESLAGRRVHYEGDYRSVTADKVTPVRIDFAPIRSEGGEILGGVGIVEDITDRREAERLVRRSEAAFRTLIEAAPDGIAVYRGGRLVFVNPAFVSELGYESPGQLLGRPVLDMIHPDDHAKFEEHSRWVLDSGKPVLPVEQQLLRRDGSVLWVEIATLPIDFDGEQAILLFAHDLTERKEMAARLAQADRMASVGTLAAGVAHEINNPLAYVLGGMDLCRRQLADLRQLLGEQPGVDSLLHSLEDCVDNARDGAGRVRIIVRDLMTFSRAESDVLVAVDVESVLESSVNLVWNEIRHRARLVKSYGGVPPVLGDEARLGQVFVNLLVNAAQAIPEGDTQHSEIRLSTSLDGGWVTIAVEDTGAGIPAGKLGRVFEPFYTTKPIGVGMGLGLSICHGIVKALGGNVTVESEPGKGSRFVVELQVAPEQARAAPEVQSDAVSQGERARILVIDDEPLLGQTLRLAFQDRHEVIVVTSGREALSRLAEDSAFDLVLCDVMMPDISGVTVYEQVHERDPELARRFVFMTGGAFTDRAREFLESYAGARLEKPFDLSQVEALLARRD